MRTCAITIAILSLGGVGSAAAQPVSDVAYLKANRCKGLAVSPAGAGIDSAGLDAFLKAQSSGRHEVIRQKGEETQARAKREGAREGAATRVAAELNGPCKAFMGGAG